MNRVRLGDVAEVILSNIDKKSVDGQAKVRLCNFTDVYYNWAITQEMYESFMKATATNSQIDSLLIYKGMVAITKDSETKYDIGISVYIADDFDDVVLGYHCVLIKPNKDLLSGKYLNVILHSSYAQKYFENHASGSGQRYTLSKEVIEDMRIPYISIEDQNKIGNIFSKIDRKIEINKQINDNLEQQMFLIFEDMMVKAKNNKIKGKYTVAKNLAQVITGKEDANFSVLNGRYKFFTCSNTPLRCNEYFFNSSSVLIAGNGDFNIKHYSGKFNAYQRTYVLSPEKKYYALLYLSSLYRINSFKLNSSGSIVKFITKGDVENIPVFIPDNSIYLEELNKLLLLKEQNSIENEELIQLRDWLLPILMNGQATISDL